MGLLKISSRRHISSAFITLSILTAIISSTIVRQPAPADADGALGQQVVPAANLAIRNALRAAATAGTETPAPSSDGAQKSNAYPKIPTGAQAGLPVGFTYTADFSSAYPFGNVGDHGKRWLPGGVDAVASYGFNPRLRVSASYYELQHYPVGFDSGTVPLFIQGFGPPVGTVDLSTAGIDVTTKDRFAIFNVERLFNFGKLPLVISPTYVSRTSTVGVGHEDVVPFEYRGFPITDVDTRTAQYYSLAFTLPFLSTPKMFGTFTAAPSWLTHLNGVNQENHTQLYQIFYVEYNLNDKTKFFIQPQASRDYLPTDPYAQHIYSYFLGASEKVGKMGFVQLVLNSGSPSNYSPYGISSLHCLALPCSQNPVIPQVGGLKATQLQLQIGIGSPSVLPF
ncbi:MAG TPA: hypothetical protein VII69_08050 [Candidatus Eremiobacteraceae bacterium]